SIEFGAKGLCVKDANSKSRAKFLCTKGAGSKGLFSSANVFAI
ncbi:1691_t:CDS:1, partial [Funneliformis caledonium]